ncbi:MAG: PAS domain S-box protein [Desulfobacterales bacterium]|nr:PAS domain S-box protein [Desulfobacterales bacterium]
MESTRRPKIERRFVLLVAACALAVASAGVFLSIRAGKESRAVVVAQFNEEQLLVARNVKHFVERELGVLKKELLALALDLSKESVNPEALYPRIESCFTRVMENGVRSIEWIDAGTRRRWRYLPYRAVPVEAAFETLDSALVLSKELGDGQIRVSLPAARGAEIFLGLSTPIPDRKDAFIGFQVNLSWFLGPFLREIRSGRTGYAWIIDGSGTFLYHPFSRFIGKSAFEARKSKFPGQNYSAINEIQRSQMLEGREGTGTYSSAWHRGSTGRIEKLIAYCPVQIAKIPPQTWSVAVVAPVYEIEEAVKKAQLWQFILQGLVLIAVGLAGFAVLGLEIRWSKTLEKRVRSRTEALRRSEEKYRSLVESAEDFIFTLDRDGSLLSVNSFTANFFGSSPDDLIGKSVHALFSGPAAQRMLKRVQRVFETEKSFREEFEVSAEDTPVWIAGNFMPLRGETGEMNAVLCIARDITESKHLERQLINTEKLASLGTLAAGVAHEINNPLGVILGFCDLLIRKQALGSQEYEDLKTIERQGYHCKEIVESLLSFARTESPGQSSTDLNSCLEEIIKIVGHTLEMNRIELVTELGGDIPAVRADCRQLQQVFLNLINNAAAAMPEGGRLFIRTAAEKGSKKAVIQFRDEGTGIRPQDMDRIFEPFFTTKPEGEGTGLGLFVSYGIIKQYGGSIECHSQPTDGPDQLSGTVFTVRLQTRHGEER